MARRLAVRSQAPAAAPLFRPPCHPCQDILFFKRLEAPVVELVDAPDSKSGSERSAGSIPAGGTIDCHTAEKDMKPVVN